MQGRRAAPHGLAGAGATQGSGADSHRKSGPVDRIALFGVIIDVSTRPHPCRLDRSRPTFDEAPLRQIVLVRHGQTDWNPPAKLNSFTDLPLNPLGQSQVSRLGRHLQATYPAFEVLTSPALRARQTAAAIVAAGSGAVETVADAVEVDFGRFEGQTVAEIKSGPDGDPYAAWEAGGAVEGIESLAEAGRRARRLLQQLVERSGADTTILVTHGLLIRVLVCAGVLDVPTIPFQRMAIDNASLTTIAITDRTVRLTGLNDTHFLRSERD